MRFLAHVEEQGGITGELLDAGESVVGGVHRRLDHAQRQRRHREHLATPFDRRLFELGQRDNGVDESHVERFLGVVLTAEEPDLAGLLLAHIGRQQARSVAAVERTDLGSGLTEPGVVGRDRQVAHDVQHVATADGVAGDHGDDRLGRATDLDLQIEHVQATDALVSHVVITDVAVVASDALIATRAERQVTLAGEDDHAHGAVVASIVEGLSQLEQRLGAKRVAHLRPVDGDLGDPLGRLVTDVGVVAGTLPLGGRADRRFSHRESVARPPGLGRISRSLRSSGGMPGVGASR